MAQIDKNKKETKKKKTFAKDFKAELKRVTWLTPKQLLNNTTAVIVIVLITAVIVFALDFTFKALNTYGINKLKAVVETVHSDETNIEDTDEFVEIEDNKEDETNADENIQQDDSTEIENAEG